MAAINVWLLCLLCVSSCNSGTTKTIYGAVSESARLRHSSPPLNPTQIQWRHNGTMFLFYNNPGELNYPQENKFQLNKTDGSLQIFNLCVNDNGNYKVTIMSTSPEISEEIRLIVVEKIKKPELKVLNASPGTGFCLVNVMCISFDNHSVEAECNITSGTSSCTETKKGSSPDLYISAQRKIISCISSNFASSNSSSISIKDYCEGFNNGSHYTTCVFLVELLLVLVALLF
nr:uncharacterized protein LOC111833145 [Paramormyrops kingsleyae]